MARTLIAGVDVGNWRIKIAYSDAAKKDAKPKLISLRSVIDEVEDYYSDSITCESKGSDWNEKSWIAAEDGDEAVMNFDSGKPKYALPLLISAMWDELKNEDRLMLAVSVPRKDQLGDDIAKALNGRHVFKKGGTAKTIVIEVLNTFHEGLGVILNERPQKKKVFLLEIGGGTLNGSAFERLKTMCPPYIIPNAGGRCLVSEVANSEEAVRQGGRVEGLSLETATKIVEAEGHRLIMPTGGTYDFSEVVKTEARKWLGRVLPEIENRCRHHLSISEMKLASGGSCLVPAVKAKLQEKGYQIASDPLWANAKGLHARAVYEFSLKGKAAAESEATAEGEATAA